MRIIVCGGRDYDWNHRNVIWDYLDALHKERPIKFLFHGNARGADHIAGLWGHKYAEDGVKVCPVPAQWKKYGKSAGPKRNKAMLGRSPDLVVAFSGGRGTANMVKQANAAGVEVREIPVVPHHHEDHYEDQRGYTYRGS